MTAPASKPPCLLGVLFCAATLTCSTAIADETGTGELEGLVRQWVQLRGQLALEKRDWSEQENAWRTEIELLTAEKQALETGLAETAVSVSEVDERRAALLAREKALEKVLDSLVPVVESAEQSLRQWRTRVPASLGQALQHALKQVPDAGRPGDRLSLSRRLQVVIAAYIEIENLQHNIHSAREMLALPGAPAREVDVLYLGLARGFAVSHDGNWAAVGTPGDDGWTWTSRPDLAAAIGQAIAVLNRQSPAAFVHLPLQVLDPTDGDAR